MVDDINRTRLLLMKANASDVMIFRLNSFDIVLLVCLNFWRVICDHVTERIDKQLRHEIIIKYKYKYIYLLRIFLVA